MDQGHMARLMGSLTHEETEDLFKFCIEALPVERLAPLLRDCLTPAEVAEVAEGIES